MLKIAVQKKGRLSDDSLKLIKECGIQFHSGSSKLTSQAYNWPIEFLFLRDDDIPGYVEDGIADIGIVGENEQLEKDKDIVVEKKLGFSKCKLSLAVPKAEEYTDLTYFNGKKVATSYPKILDDFFTNKNIDAEIHEISGSVEIAPNIGLAEGICDIVSSGGTLISNGLKEVEIVMKSEAVLISHKGIDDEKRALLDRLMFRIDSVQRAKNTKYITLNAPTSSVDQIIDILPGVKSPSIMPLAKEGWSSIHSVVNENDFWTIVEKLREAGAEGILVLPIEKIVH